MNCPVDNNIMIILEYNDVEVDYCTKCGGIWLDAGEIELLFGNPEECAAFLTIGGPADAKGEEIRRCPRCRAKMSKEATESDPPIIFDYCPNGDGMWFDNGELAQVLEHSASLGDRKEVTEFLRGIFVSNEEGPGTKGQ